MGKGKKDRKKGKMQQEREHPEDQSEYTEIDPLEPELRQVTPAPEPPESEQHGGAFGNDPDPHQDGDEQPDPSGSPEPQDSGN